METKYLSLDKLNVYQLARELSRVTWKIYQQLSWQDKKIMGDQFIESTDSIGANTAEGYGRFHYLDKTKFYYNARGSLLESHHCFEVLDERHKVHEQEKNNYLSCYQNIQPALNGLIMSALKAKKS